MSQTHEEKGVGFCDLGLKDQERKKEEEETGEAGEREGEGGHPRRSSGSKDLPTYTTWFTCSVFTEYKGLSIIIRLPFENSKIKTKLYLSSKKKEN